MTDREILELLLKEITDMKTDMSDIKTEISDMKTEIFDMKTEMSDMKTEMSDMKTEMSDMKKDINGIKRKIMVSTAELKAMDSMILDEVERVHEILDKHKADTRVHSA